MKEILRPHQDLTAVKPVLFRLWGECIILAARSRLSFVDPRLVRAFSFGSQRHPRRDKILASANLKVARGECGLPQEAVSRIARAAQRLGGLDPVAYVCQLLKDLELGFLFACVQPLPTQSFRHLQEKYSGRCRILVVHFENQPRVARQLELVED
jgi:hypothetical protein